MDMLLNCIKCVNCLNILSSPILLPCGHSVCKAHINTNNQSCMCNSCGIKHFVFLDNKSLEKVILSRIGAFDFGDVHKEAKKSCKHLHNVIAQIDVLIKDPNDHIYDLFSELRRQVDLKYEEYKLQLDQEIERLRAELDRLENECKQKLKPADDLDCLNKLRNAKETAQCNLDAYLTALNEFKVDEKKWTDIQVQCNQQIEELQEMVFDYRSLLTEEIYSKKFCVDFNVSIDFGSSLPQYSKSKMDSQIIKGAKMKKDLIGLCEFKPGTKYSLLYRGSRDGFEGKDFHSRCDNKPKTLTIIKSTSECIFGGYTEAEWTKNIKYKRDPNGFLFSLVNNKNEPIKMKISNGQEDYAIWYDKDFGPTFGQVSSDLIIHPNDCNNNKKSFSNLGHTYKHPKYEYNSDESNSFLAGSQYFQVAEIEVFQLG